MVAVRRWNLGFTLVELLVALAITALLAAMGWRTLDAMQGGLQAYRVRGDAVQAVEDGLQQWGADLDALADIPQTQALLWDGKTLRLTRAASTDPGGGLIVVAWTLAEREGQQQWLRWQSTPFSTRQAWVSAWAAAQAWSQGTGGEVLRRRETRFFPVQEWRLYYFRGGTWSHPLSSAGGTGAKTENPAGLPDGVRLMVTPAPGHVFTGTLVRDWGRVHVSGAAS